MAQKVEKFKRKTHIERTGPAWRSESISSKEYSFSPPEKKSQIDIIFTTDYVFLSFV